MATIYVVFVTASIFLLFISMLPFNINEFFIFYTNFFQHVIPQTLLDHYVSMTEPAKAQTIDTEIVRHCAFSLPAVALTLGRKNWPCLRDTYELLTSDMQVWNC